MFSYSKIRFLHYLIISFNENPQSLIINSFSAISLCRTSEPLPSVGSATASSLEAAAASVDSSGNIKTINNNIHHNGQAQPQKSQQQQLSVSNLNNNNNNNKNPNSQNGVPGSMTSASNRADANQNQSQNGDSRRSSSLDPDADPDDVVDMAHNGAFEDDMEALLPKCSRRSRDELSQVRFL